MVAFLADDLFRFKGVREPLLLLILVVCMFLLHLLFLFAYQIATEIQAAITAAVLRLISTRSS